MMLPDLEKYHIKRSRVSKDVEYVYACHGMGSLSTFRKGAFDWYDTILCPGIDQFNEIRATEEVYGTKKKRLVEAGYPLIDEMLEKYESEEHPENARPQILIAPSWQADNIIDLCAEELLDSLRSLDCEIILRPHPQQVRHEPEKFEEMKTRFADVPNIEIQTDFSSNNPIMESDILITDWSDIGWEFAFVTKRPVLYIDTPMKVMNPEYEKIGIEPINRSLRTVLGEVIAPDELEKVPETIGYMLGHREEYRERIAAAFEEHVYNIGKSAKLCGRYVIKRLTPASKQS
jgi:YidC/Oxa1 family membrane protein insertase